MLNRLRNLFGRRSYQAAGGGRRGESMHTMPAPLSSVAVARGPIAMRAKYAVGSNPLAAAGVQAWQTQAIGAGIVPASRHPDKSIREALTARFSAWVDVADDEGRTDWFGIQASLFRSMVTAGEGLALMLNTPEGLRLRVLDPEQLDTSHSATLTSGRIVQGVEFDNAGHRVAYWIFDHPLGLDFGIHRQRQRIPAEDVIHVFRQDWPGQVRGLSWFAPVLVRLTDLDSWRDGQLVRQKVAAFMTGFITSMDGSGSQMEGQQKGSTITGAMTPGEMIYLDPGQDIKFSHPAQIGQDVIDFASITEREVATGLGLPAHAFGDVTKANYSSLKQATTAWKARCEAIQWHCFIPQVCVPVWRRWATLEVLSGRIQTTVELAMPVKHTTPRFADLEPVKTVTAEIMELEAGLTTRRALLAARGEDVEQVDADLKEEQDRAKALGLTFGKPQPANENEPPATAEAA